MQTLKVTLVVARVGYGSDPPTGRVGLDGVGSSCVGLCRSTLDDTEFYVKCKVYLVNC